MAVSKDAGNTVSCQGQIPRPFLKWPGGKRRVVPFLLPHLDLPAKRLVEPFCGSCALSLAVADRVENVWLNDINSDLINLLKQITKNPVGLIEVARGYFSLENNNNTIYYEIRDNFNESSDQLIRAAIFLYLNRFGYNGLCRYNSKNKFNVPFGRYKKPYFPEKEISYSSSVLCRSKLTCNDFEDILDSCGRGDIVYCDPPYVPLSLTSSFTTYAAGGFSLADQERLITVSKKAAKKGAIVIISNHDTPYMRSLLKGAYIDSIDVRRNISCNVNKRFLIKELIAVFR